MPARTAGIMILSKIKRGDVFVFINWQISTAITMNRRFMGVKIVGVWFEMNEVIMVKLLIFFNEILYFQSSYKEQRLQTF
ncbi:hypothetical protein AN642_03090 [Epulopiscium sp. SCG-B10WGA-EpuloA2]|nr:hypothetical protein AN642_03090 [Epulopiscium sp. SCG-B10WGA-EpuloA2]